MALNLPSKSSQECSEQETQSPDLGELKVSSQGNIFFIAMYDECREWIKLVWVKKKLEERRQQRRSSSFEPFTLSV